jgi:hypothetical protein
MGRARAWMANGGIDERVDDSERMCGGVDASCVDGNRAKWWGTGFAAQQKQLVPVVCGTTR